MKHYSIFRALNGNTAYVCVGLVSLSFSILTLAAQTNSIPMDLSHVKAGQIWGQPTHGVQASLGLNFGNIPYSTARMQPDGTLKTIIVPAPPNTNPVLTVIVRVKNVSSQTVYLLADKSASGTDLPSFLKVIAGESLSVPKLLDLHPQQFLRQISMELQAGKSAEFIEHIPYAMFKAFPKNEGIAATLSIVNVKPNEAKIAKPDAVCVSNTVTPPWNELELYLDQIKSNAHPGN